MPVGCFAAGPTTPVGCFIAAGPTMPVFAAGPTTPVGCFAAGPTSPELATDAFAVGPTTPTAPGTCFAAGPTNPETKPAPPGQAAVFAVAGAAPSPATRPTGFDATAAEGVGCTTAFPTGPPVAVPTAALAVVAVAPPPSPNLATSEPPTAADFAAAAAATPEAVDEEDAAVSPPTTEVAVGLGTAAEFGSCVARFMSVVALAAEDDEAAKVTGGLAFAARLFIMLTSFDDGVSMGAVAGCKGLASAGAVPACAE
mmetsp:Transcript_14140/g.35055  ORF Transcript_14140/g.35055 Transcript_14140/m.35055 type:complete len:255 (+) Transcript_14140:1267-2031(+)